MPKYRAKEKSMSIENRNAGPCNLGLDVLYRRPRLPRKAAQTEFESCDGFFRGGHGRLGEKKDASPPVGGLSRGVMGPGLGIGAGASLGDLGLSVIRAGCRLRRVGPVDRVGTFERAVLSAAR